jgi:membrane protein implicated in regulation of membrane protease activity
MTPAARLARLLPIGLGLAYGIFFVFTSPYLDAPLWPVWAPLVVAFTATAGVVFVYGLNRWAKVSEEHKVRPSAVAGRIATIIALPLLVLIGSTQLPDRYGQADAMSC